MCVYDTHVVLVKALHRAESIGYLWIDEWNIYFKVLTHEIVGIEESKICRTGCHDGNPGRISVLESWARGFFFKNFSKAFNWLNKGHHIIKDNLLSFTKINIFKC